MNLYVHFPFCRAKCAYCALLSRAGASATARAAYVERVRGEIAAIAPREDERLTVYFGGGTPTLCALTTLAEVLAPLVETAGDVEFTVELHPLDATGPALDALRRLGVNRISMGVQSFDDAALAAMGRLHTASEAEAAFRRARRAFPNAGLDLIAGWPGVSAAAWRAVVERALALEPVHVSCYTLIREPRTRLDLMARRGEVEMPGDDAALEQADVARAAFASVGLSRYEVSNFALPGFECRHNLAVWRGEDYVGIGEGAHGREGCARTMGLSAGYERSVVSDEEDAVERALLSLRTAGGIDLAAVARSWPLLAPRISSWRATLAALRDKGILHCPSPDVFAPTSRGFEVCDAVMSALI
jgi:oxygen-independent coproporphyrinogen-3 oxidase